MKNVKCAVIGVGHLGKIHAKLLNQLEYAELVGVSDPNETVRTAVAQEHSVESYECFADLIGKVDCAIVASPTRCHFETCKELLNQGIHVLVEKPMTLNSVQSESLCELADEKGLVLQVGHVERFNPAFCAAKSHLSNPQYIEATRQSSYTFR